ncbi:MAG: threonine synthase, partial [Muribaculaceae bacterium]|nr:threonine synthase [Muribaculaceae bacterium]
MFYYSTNHQSQHVTLEQAVLRGIAPDRGLFLPESIPTIPKAFFNNIGEMTLPEIAYVVANTLFGDDITSDDLNETVKEAFTFDIPVTHVTDNRYALELFHGPTLASKDLGSRFMARMLRFFNARVNGNNALVNVIVATSGDAGAAVANGFHHVPGVRVIALYPKGRLTKAQEAQIATLGDNIVAIEVRGDFDDCQRMAKDAFFDTELNEKMILTSANSINVASLLPQTIYFFTAYAQLIHSGKSADQLSFAIPAGNLGHVTSAIIAKRMGVPIDKIIVADNHNDIFYQYVT